MTDSYAHLSEKDYLEKVQTIDGIIETLYAVISGEKEEIRDWNLFEYLFHPEAKLMPYCKDLEGKVRVQYWSTDFYKNTIGKWKETKRKTGFFETEIKKIVHEYANIAHVWSTYECRHNKSDKEPYERGMNSFQLLYHNNRWWIINNFWQGEIPENPIPEKYLKNRK